MYRSLLALSAHGLEIASNLQQTSPYGWDHLRWSNKINYFWNADKQSYDLVTDKTDIGPARVELYLEPEKHGKIKTDKSNQNYFQFSLYKTF